MCPIVKVIIIIFNQYNPAVSAITMVFFYRWSFFKSFACEQINKYVSKVTDHTVIVYYSMKSAKNITGLFNKLVYLIW